MSDWTDSLQQASFRGVPFGVLAGSSRFGRRIALHEYPKRDDPWPEDMGRSTRRFALTGFLISDSAVYGGGDVIAQREAMVAAAEASGAGDLVHPTFGRLTVSLVDLDVIEKWDRGRYFEVSFAFYEAGKRQFPAATAATGDAVSGAADSVGVASTADFTTRLKSSLPGLPSLGPLNTVASGFAGRAVAAAGDATSLFHLAGQLQGSYGRFAGGGSLTGGITSLVAQASGLRGEVAGAAAVFEGLTSKLGVSGSSPAGVASAAAGVASSLRKACAAPADGIRLLAQLAQIGR